MTPVFADTACFLALLNPADRWHSQARGLSARPGTRLVTSEFVLTEVGDALSQPENRPHFARLLELLRAQPDAEIVPASAALFQQGCRLHAARPDKERSLTDCISFVLMNDRRIELALTCDHHFAQAGFQTLMQSP